MTMDSAMYSSRSNGHAGESASIKSLKRPLTLELDPSSVAYRKRARRGANGDCMTVDGGHLPSFGASSQGAVVLGSPDLKQLKLSTPELENLIMLNANGMTPTPSAANSSVSFVNGVKSSVITREQEDYARGFDEALQKLQRRSSGTIDSSAITAAIYTSSSSSPSVPLTVRQISVGQANEAPAFFASTSVSSSTTTTSSSSCSHPVTIRSTSSISNGSSSSRGHNTTSGGGIITELASKAPSSVSSNESQNSNSSTGHGNLYNSDGVMIKREEGGFVTSSHSLGPLSSPPASPINMMNQERLKLERKRQRNRVAARKCRHRKLERISCLEDKVRKLKGENADLGTKLAQLREHVCHLKEEVMEHVRQGCQITSPAEMVNL